ncbi:hypothetical protein [Streptomyces sp. 1222.5]|uniref:hypothetical protein n=1 Tax=Streptomyces sp. 1222.5 TaxID=1881026 RepID=UPI003D723CCA
MIDSRDRIDVVLDVYTEDDAYRVRMVGVFQPDQPKPSTPQGATRNIVQTFLDVKTDVRAFGLGRAEEITVCEVAAARPGSIREGSTWVWEPLKPHVRQDVRVVAVELRGGEWWVQTENTTSSNGSVVGARSWNEVSRFVEACVLVEPAAGTTALADIPSVSKASSAREDLLNTFAQWMLTTGRGSRAHADRILNRHAQEHADQLLAKANQMAILRSEDARLKAEGLRIGAALIAPEDTR